ncbi:hypothetical protein Tco_0366963 [Tanacetum coccineum]
MQISSILSRETLLDVRSAYGTIFCEESHRVVASSSSSGTSQRSQSSVFNSNVGNRSNVHRPKTFGTSARPPNMTRPFKYGNRRPNGGSALVYENCGFNGHTIDRCFKIIGYPSDEHISKLISLIKENSDSQLHSALIAAGLIVDSGANQHLTYTDKYLVNVTDISKLRIKVSHPNVSEALITMVGNMKLIEHLTLYDVLVVPEYCVSLISVHKVARDSKFVVAFDESHCYVFPYNLREMKLLGIGKQNDGLYYFDGKQDLVILLTKLCLPLKMTLFLKKTIGDKYCEICQNDKQTRESFPLSDHSSTEGNEFILIFGDLIN